MLNLIYSKLNLTKGVPKSNIVNIQINMRFNGSPLIDYCCCFQKESYNTSFILEGV